MPTFTCPKGHTATLRDEHTPICKPCNLIATSFNAGDGIVHQWTDQDEHEEGCRRLQDDMDDAFDNQYFGDW